MSGRLAPPWMALRMSLLMNAEQCSPNFSGAVRLQRDRPDLLGALDVQVARGRFLEERARAGRAGFVHRIVDGDAVVQQDVLGVLAADLEQRVDVGLEERGACRVRDDLVVDAGGFQEHAEQLARRAGGGDQADAGAGAADLSLHLRQAALERRDGVAVRAPVMGGRDLQGFGVDQRHLGRRRAAVDAEHVLGAGPQRAAPRGVVSDAGLRRPQRRERRAGGRLERADQPVGGAPAAGPARGRGARRRTLRNTSLRRARRTASAATPPRGTGRHAGSA